jgi:predicted nucleic acid-binding protein
VILIDTGPLVALCDQRDGRHRTALADLAALLPARLALCESVLTEACFHLPHHQQRQRLWRWLDELDVAPAPFEAGPDFWADIFAWLARHEEHEPDWADACLAVLSGRETAAKVWTYDREFTTTWRRLDGSAIPLTAARRR